MLRRFGLRDGVKNWEGLLENVPAPGARVNGRRDCLTQIYAPYQTDKSLSSFGTIVTLKKKFKISKKNLLMRNLYFQYIYIICDISSC